MSWLNREIISLAEKASSRNIFLHTSILFLHLAKQVSRSESIDAGTLLALEREI
jgi:hypothetical protein